MSSGRHSRKTMNRHEAGLYDEPQLDRMRWIASLWLAGHLGMVGIVAWEQWAPALPVMLRMALAFAPV